MMSDVQVRFVHISDTHITHPGAATPDFASYPANLGAAALVEQINALPFRPDFVLHTGDVAYDPDPTVYATAQSILNRIRYPVYYLPGNHDHGETVHTALNQFKDPTSLMLYEIEVNGVQIVCVDSNGPAPVPAGFVTQDQLLRLSEICGATDDDRPLVIAIHHNPIPVGVPWLDGWMGVTNGEALHQILVNARHRLRGVFFGHIHQNITVMQDGILYSSVLSSWYQLHAYPDQMDTTFDRDAEPGFNVVTVRGNQTFIRRHRFPAPKP